jgi:hypothetical protein
MSGYIVSVEQEAEDVFIDRPHVVILGSGASAAAFPHGDRDGKKVPVMEDLVSVAGLGDELSKAGIDHAGRSFPEIFRELHGNPEFAHLIPSIESRVAACFADLHLPDGPTLYDHLVLSLRPKDVIATFTWDPLLYDACQRNRSRAPLPHVLHMIGSVRMGRCPKDRRTGVVGARCRLCGSTIVPPRLPFRPRRGRYPRLAFTKEWNAARSALEKAYVLTIFGRIDLASDIASQDLMRLAWNKAGAGELQEIEIIDLTWRDERSPDHVPVRRYQVVKDFYDSRIAKHPRRTCEAIWRQLVEAKFETTNDVPRNYDFPGLYEWCRPLIEAENRREEAFRLKTTAVEMNKCGRVMRKDRPCAGTEQYPGGPDCSGSHDRSPREPGLEL